MSETLKFGNGQWAVKEGSALAYNDENGNFKPLPFTFDRSTSATRVNKQGLIEVVPNNEPRIDFLNDSKGALLLETQRMNSFSYSEPIANVGAASGISYEPFIWTLGFTNCVKLGDNSAVRFRYGGSVLASTQYTVSAFVIMDDLSEPLVGNSSSVGDFSFVIGGVVGGVVNSNVHYGNNIYRVSATLTSGSNLSNNGVIKYTTQSSKGFRITGFQLEQGSYATSYIPTQGSIGTRVAESCGINNLDDNVASQNAWTAAGEFIKGQDKDNSLYIMWAYYLGTTNLFRIRDYSNSVRFYLFEPTEQSYGVPFNLGQSVKWSIRAKSDGTYTLYVNGNLIVERSGTFRKLDAYNLFGNVKVSLNNLKIYNEALTDQELQQLTKI